MAKDKEASLLAPPVVEPTLLEVFLAMTAELEQMGMPIVYAVEHSPHLPVGIYPCRLIGVVLTVEVEESFINESGVEEKRMVKKLFSSKHGFKLNDDKNGIVVTPNSANDKEWDDETTQIGMMFEVVSGKYAGKHIPKRFNVLGFMTRADYSSKEWDASEYVEKGGYACTVDENGRFTRVINDKNKEKGCEILASALGAMLPGIEINGKPANQVYLKMLLDAGTEIFCNVVFKEDLKDPKKRVEPMFFNEYNESLSTFPEEDAIVEDKENDEV